MNASLTRPGRIELEEPLRGGDDGFDGETEVLEQWFGGRRVAEAVDADDVAARADVAPPAARRTGLDDEARAARRQDVIAIFLGLPIERLRARHRHDARRNLGLLELARGADRELQFRAGRDQRDGRRLVAVRNDVAAARDRGNLLR